MTPRLSSEPTTDVAPETITAALGRIPPLWPLKHFVAVNPFVGLLQMPFVDACSVLERATGSIPLQAPSEYLKAWESGTIQPADLAEATDENWTSARLVDALKSEDKGTGAPLKTFADFLDAKLPTAHWGSFVVEEISKWCAVSFDENQTTWRSPWRDEGLYAGWKAAASLDLNPETFGLRRFRAFVSELPDDSAECIRVCVQRLSPASDLVDFLHRQLASVSGWAGYLQYLVREDGMRGRANDALRDLLAIRLAFDAALFDTFWDERKMLEEWRGQSDRPRALSLVPALAKWQVAYETGFQRKLAANLTQPRPEQSFGRPTVQAIFCIDVRSEVFRRHLEAASPGLQSIGFAGFFGFPVAHKSIADGMGSRCPVLLVPPAETKEAMPLAVELSERASLAEAGAWKAFQNSAASCFSFVETVGLGFGALLGRQAGGASRSCCSAPPVFDLGDAASLETRASMAEGALRNMSLTRNFARLVLICGHGSQSANNPYASGLDCGACGGHAGDVNARLAAAALNDPAVRTVLESKGISIPGDTSFLAGLHNTTTDEVALFDLENVPASHAADLSSLQKALAEAGNGARMERGGTLAIAPAGAEQTKRALGGRATDISQVRPEWGLANNAALVAGPRHRTSALNLEGRVFLHDYDESADPDNKVLTLILCAPVVVASWINLQYYASRVDPENLGSGNKVLHNVASGIGVFEGNGGDLKVGLPLQSIHDGERFVHEPRRLSVFIEAASGRIDEVLEANPSVRQLFDHGWIHLFSLNGNNCHRYTPDGWLILHRCGISAGKLERVLN